MTAKLVDGKLVNGEFVSAYRSTFVALATLVGFAATFATQATLLRADELVAAQLTRILEEENAANEVTVEPIAVVSDEAFLRRVYVDLIGRIPTTEEVDQFASMPAATRRATLVDRLLEDERFADTWTTFFADMLRLRSNADGGAAAIAWVHQSIQDGMPYDEMARRFIAANGKAGATPEVGFVLGDNADPMALAGATSQIFLGIRIACAECHDHPFDVWSQEDFYGLAAFFGKTRRVETQFTNTVYTTEASQSSVLWPPEGTVDAAERKPMKPTFPFAMAEVDAKAEYIARLRRLRADLAKVAAVPDKQDTSVDDLLAALDDKVERAATGRKTPGLDVAAEAKRDAKNLQISSNMASESELRRELARLITDPKNEYFARCFVNRVWHQLIGRGFVNPVDDFSENNPPSHPKTLDFLAREFVASGYDVKGLIRTIIHSQPYSRGHAYDVEEGLQAELETAFLATPMRRMTSEVLYDSIITAGHLFEPKHADGKNLKTVWRQTRVAKEGTDTATISDQVAADTPEEMKRPTQAAMKRPGYNLESAIEIDFDALLAKKGEAEGVAIEKMQVMSKEELEAKRMEQQSRERRNVEYVDRFVKSTIDDNPSFSTAFRMASPAPADHFLRVFGQTDRTQLGNHRDHSPSMRQALMMLNGRLTHEASRVGESEPLYALLTGESRDLDAAIVLAYREILTRRPSKEEAADAKAIVGEAEDVFSGIADLRWLLLNCDEFRFLP